MALYGEVFLKENYYVASRTCRSIKMHDNLLLLLMNHDIPWHERKLTRFQWVTATRNITILILNLNIFKKSAYYIFQSKPTHPS